MSLIYQSARLADWVHRSVMKFTPMIARGEAEFFFVANDPTRELLDHLRIRRYQHVVNINQRYSNEELFALGYAAPEYMSRVYRGYNMGMRHARGDLVVLVNSDNYFSPDWLENLMKYSDRSRVISSTLVERHHPRFSVFPGAFHGEFGGTPETFDEAGFLAFASRIKKTGLEPGSAYMPTLFHRDIAMEAGLYPCGNVAGQAFEHVTRYGDEAFFDTLESLGVSHFTALDSISYHLKEGERDDAPAPSPGEVGEGATTETPASLASPTPTPAIPYPINPALGRVLDTMAPTKRHSSLMAGIVATTGEAPATRTLRQLLKSGRLSGEAEDRAKTRIAALDDAEALESQARRLRRVVERIVGEPHTDSAMRVIHSVSWLTRPLRRAWVVGNRKRTRS